MSAPLMLRTRLSAAIICALMLLTGCATHETFGDRSLPQGERAVIEGYWRYVLLYFEESQIVSIDGELVGGPFAYASSLSVPAGKHWLQFMVLRNNRAITTCAFEWIFEAGYHYKLHQLRHEQALLAHPTSSRFQASIVMDISGPAGTAQRLSARAECGPAAHCLRTADCPPNRSCQTDTGFAFGVCIR